MADTGDIVADRIHRGHKHSMLIQGWRGQVVDDPRVVVHPRAEVPVSRGVEEAVVSHAGDVRKTGALLVRGHQRPLIDAWDPAAGRLDSLAHPSIQRYQQRPREGVVAVGFDSC